MPHDGISYQQLAFLSSFSGWQLIQNLGPSAIVWHQCDIQFVFEKISNLPCTLIRPCLATWNLRVWIVNKTILHTWPKFYFHQQLLLVLIPLVHDPHLLRELNAIRWIDLSCSHNEIFWLNNENPKWYAGAYLGLLNCGCWQ